jgi:hypothetical protein
LKASDAILTALQSVFSKTEFTYDCKIVDFSLPSLCYSCNRGNFTLSVSFFSKFITGEAFFFFGLRNVYLSASDVITSLLVDTSKCCLVSIVHSLTKATKLV